MSKFLLPLIVLVSSCSLFDGDDVERVDQYSGNFIAYSAINTNVLDKVGFVLNHIVNVDTQRVSLTELRLVVYNDETYGFRSSSSDVASFILKYTREFENTIDGSERVLSFDCQDEYTSFCEFQNLGSSDVMDFRRVDIPFNVTEMLSWILRIDGNIIHLRYERNTDPDNVLGPNDKYVLEFKGELVIE